MADPVAAALRARHGGGNERIEESDALNARVKKTQELS